MTNVSSGKLLLPWPLTSELPANLTVPSPGSPIFMYGNLWALPGSLLPAWIFSWAALGLLKTHLCVSGFLSSAAQYDVPWKHISCLVYFTQFFKIIVSDGSINLAPAALFGLGVRCFYNVQLYLGVSLLTLCVLRVLSCLGQKNKNYILGITVVCGKDTTISFLFYKYSCGRS